MMILKMKFGWMRVTTSGLVVNGISKFGCGTTARSRRPHRTQYLYPMIQSGNDDTTGLRNTGSMALLHEQPSAMVILRGRPTYPRAGGLIQFNTCMKWCNPGTIIQQPSFVFSCIGYCSRQWTRVFIVSLRALLLHACCSELVLERRVAV